MTAISSSPGDIDHQMHQWLAVIRRLTIPPALLLRADEVIA